MKSPAIPGKIYLLAVLAAVFLSTFSFAQNPQPGDERLDREASQKLALTPSVGIGTFESEAAEIPPPSVTILQLGSAQDPDSRVHVPQREEVRLVPPANAPEGAHWYKDGERLGLILGTLIVSSAQPSTAGIYSFIDPATGTRLGNRIILTVGTVPKFVNFSSRLRLAPGKDVQVVGFVVTSDKPNDSQILVRVVGNTLKEFGIEKVVTQPRLRLYDGKGQRVVLPHEAAAPWQKTYFNALFAAAGAFPLVNEDIINFASFDYGRFPAGAYTLHVSDESEGGGEVLVEVYEMPDALWP